MTKPKPRFVCRVCGRRFDRCFPFNGMFPTVCYAQDCRIKAHRADVKASALRCKARAAKGN